MTRNLSISNRHIAFLFCLALLWTTVNCSRPPGKSGESFEEFYNRFHTDLEFQMKRVKFPLEGSYVNAEGETQWAAETWEMHKQKVTDISEPDYDTEIIRTDDLVTDKVQLRGAGLYTERKFRKIRGKWYLVYYKTVDL